MFKLQINTFCKVANDRHLFQMQNKCVHFTFDVNPRNQPVIEMLRLNYFMLSKSTQQNT